MHDGGKVAAPGAYDARLTNEQLAPLREQRWSAYDISAFWMSDVHSVGGYATAGALFALGLDSLGVFVALMLGITVVLACTQLAAMPSQRAGIPYPVVARLAFGVRGANIAAIIRGCIATAWFGIQTYLAAAALLVVVLKLVPSASALLDLSFLGLSVLGYLCYAALWLAQVAILWHGIDAVRRFVDFAGPAVYVVMVVLCLYLCIRADWDIDVSAMGAGANPLAGLDLLWAVLAGAAVTVGYFAGPMLNFGDFARYVRSPGALRTGNLVGLPLNFLVFSVLSVVTTAATLPVFGRLLTDPVATVAAIDTTFAIVLGGLTFVTATVGINLVANFVSPAFDFSNVSPSRISWRAGGMTAATGSVLLTPWNWYGSPEAILWSVGILGALIGPLFGILVVDYYLVQRQRLLLDDLYTLAPSGRYWYWRGYNPAAIAALVAGGGCAIAALLVPHLTGDVDWLPPYSWFIGCIMAGVVHRIASGRRASP